MNKFSDILNIPCLCNSNPDCEFCGGTNIIKNTKNVQLIIHLVKHLSKINY